LLKDICNDVDIRSGIVRQRSNDKLSCFEVDLSTVIGDMSIPFTNLKNKLDLIKIFQNQDEIIIEENETDFSIEDRYTKISFEKPDLAWLDNPFMSESDRDSIFVRDEGNIILSCDLSESMSERIFTITQAFQVTVVQIEFEGEVASIIAETQSRDQTAKIMKDIVSERDLTAISHMPHTPFIVDHDGDIEFKMYLSNEEKMECSNVFNTTVDNIPVTVYCRSVIRTDVDNE
jgi:hypothetical protein